MKNFALSFLACVFLCHNANASDFKSIKIEGNKRIEDSTIISHMGIDTNKKDISRNDLDIAIKKLYETGLFKNIGFVEENGNAVVNLTENPMIYSITIEGNKRIKSTEILPELSLSSRSILNLSKVHNDISTIQRLYQRSGRYAATVDAKIIELEHNRVNLIYTVSEGPKTLIGKISFLGNENVSQGKLKSIIFSKEAGILRFFSTSPHFDIDKINYDRELISRFYLSRGYADIQVKEPIIKLDVEHNYFMVTFIIDEGKKYKFRDISIRSQMDDINVDNLKSFIIPVKGKVFNYQEIEDSIEKMTDFLGDQGFAFADIEPEVVKHEDEIDIIFVVKPVPKYYVNKINIKGNIRTYDKVIRREFDIYEGDAYKASAINKAENRLNDLDYFETVDIHTKPSMIFDDKVDIDVEVKEKSTGSFNFAVGISDVDGPVGKVEFTEDNFVGTGKRLSLSVSRAKSNTNFGMNFVDPYFLDKDISAGFSLEKSLIDKTNERRFTSKTKGLALKSGYKIHNDLFHYLYYRYRDGTISDLDAGASVLLKEQEGRNQTSMIGHEISFNNLDSKIYPTKGVSARVSQDFAGLGGNVAFLRHQAKASYFKPIVREDVVLCVSAEAGHIRSIRNKKILVTERFFMGGETVRGFADYGIGPRDNVKGQALGGNVFAAGKVELSVPLGLPKELDMKGLIFSDFGTLGKLDYKNYAGLDKSLIDDKLSIRASYGIGVSWNSPIGLISLSAAKAIKKESFDKTKTVRVSFMNQF